MYDSLISISFDWKFFHSSVSQGVKELAREAKRRVFGGNRTKKD